MQNISINRNKVVFVNLTEMDKYEGLEQNLAGGGRYVEDNGYGHEIFNFKIDNEKCYGYTPPYSKLNLSRISDEISEDEYGKYIDNVFVVFTCSRENVGRVICGCYQSARVYAEPIQDNKISRRFTAKGKVIFAEYNIVCNAQNALLIDRNDRSKKLPRASSTNLIGHGQKSIWYVDKPERQNLKNELMDYLCSVISQTDHNDEYKYHLHNESKKYTTSTTQIYRSQFARSECIRLKGCRCNICGFDFEKEYGKLGKDYIEVHHITPVGILSSSDGYSGTDPQNDLIPLCSNCHSMVHRKRPPLQPQELKEILSSKNGVDYE